MKTVNLSNVGFFEAAKKAVTDNEFEIVKALIEESAFDINYIDADGQTLLHIACKLDNTDLVKILLSYGADAAKKDNYGNTPSDLALMLRFEKFDEVIKNHQKYKTPTRKTFVLVGADMQDQPLVEITKAHNVPTIAMGSEDEYKNALKQITEVVKDTIKSDLNAEFGIIIFTHGNKKGKIMIAGKSRGVDTIVSDLQVGDKTGSQYLFDVLTCYAGIGLLQTEKSQDTQDQVLVENRDGYLSGFLPDNCHIVFDGGKYMTFMNPNNFLIGLEIECHDKSIFRKQIAKMLFPQTFKFFCKLDGTIKDFKYNAPKAEEFIPDSISQEKTIIQSYQEYLISKIKQFRKFYLETHPQLLTAQISEIIREEREMISIISDEKQFQPIFDKYINSHFIGACEKGNTGRVKYFLDNADLLKAQNIAIDTESFQIGEIPPYQKQSPLLVALAAGSLGVVKMLFPESISDEKCKSMLRQASLNGHLDLVEFLLEKNVMLDEGDFAKDLIIDLCKKSLNRIKNLGDEDADSKEEIRKTYFDIIRKIVDKATFSNIDKDKLCMVFSISFGEEIKQEEFPEYLDRIKNDLIEVLKEKASPTTSASLAATSKLSGVVFNTKSDF